MRYSPWIVCVASWLAFGIAANYYVKQSYSLSKHEQWVVDAMRQCPRSAVYVVGYGLEFPTEYSSDASYEGKGTVPTERLEDAEGWRDVFIRRFHDPHHAGELSRKVRSALLEE